eukprot:c23407_g2_i1 orf=285-1091(+)
MRKRERENPCFVCRHYHKFEDGEVCGVCGHRLQDAAEKTPPQSAFSTEILPSFLYLGSYDNASRAELLKTQGITRILNMVPTCQNLYKNSFAYYNVKEDKTLPFDECVEYIEQSRQDEARVLVHCMSGQSRSPAVVIAYLMRHKGWMLPQSYQWVKDRRPLINLSSAVAQQLHNYEMVVFGPNASHAPMISTENGACFGFGFPNPTPTVTTPIFSNYLVSSSLSPAPFLFGSKDNSCNSGNFVFGAIQQEHQTTINNLNGTDSSMDST